MNTLSTRNDWHYLGNRRRPLHQRLLWRLSRRVPLDGITLSSPLIVQGLLSLVGAVLAVLVGFTLVALVLATAALGCLTCQLRRHSSPVAAFAPPVRVQPQVARHRYYRVR